MLLQVVFCLCVEALWLLLKLGKLLASVTVVEFPFVGMFFLGGGPRGGCLALMPGGSSYNGVNIHKGWYCILFLALPGEDYIMIVVIQISFEFP